MIDDKGLKCQGIGWDRVERWTIMYGFDRKVLNFCAGPVVLDLIWFDLIWFLYKDLFTHKDINTYINGVVKICLNKFFFVENTGFQKKREKICKIMHK